MQDEIHERDTVAPLAFEAFCRFRFDEIRPTQLALESYYKFLFMQIQDCANNAILICGLFVGSRVTCWQLTTHYSLFPEACVLPQSEYRWSILGFPSAHGEIVRATISLWYICDSQYPNYNGMCFSAMRSLARLFSTLTILSCPPFKPVLQINTKESVYTSDQRKESTSAILSQMQISPCTFVEYLVPYFLVIGSRGLPYVVKTRSAPD